MKIKCVLLGDIVHYKGVRLQVINAVDKCRGCYFRRYSRCPTEVIGVCCRPWRYDDIIFRQVDKNKAENNHKRINAYGKKKK